MGKTIDSIIGKIERFFEERIIDSFMQISKKENYNKDYLQTPLPMPKDYDSKKNEEDSLMD